MKTSHKLALVVAAAGVLVAARTFVAREAVANPPLRLEAGASVPHMDHAPRHGGLLLMRGDTHFEVVLHADGLGQVYFSDATRADLPASFAQRVELGLATIDGERQNVALQPDPSGTMWIGHLKTTGDPQAIVRITYVAAGESPYWIDVPLSAWYRVQAVSVP